MGRDGCPYVSAILVKIRLSEHTPEDRKFNANFFEVPLLIHAGLLERHDCSVDEKMMPAWQPPPFEKEVICQRYVQRVTGYSRAQVARLIGQYQKGSPDTRAKRRAPLLRATLYRPGRAPAGQDR